MKTNESPTTGWTVLESELLPAENVARGLALTRSLDSIVESGHWTELRLPRLIEFLPAHVSYLDDQPDVLVVECTRRPDATSGDVVPASTVSKLDQFAASDSVIDVRNGAAWLWWFVENQKVILEIKDRKVSVGVVAVSPDEAMANWSPPASPDVPSPPLESVFSASATRVWLANEVRTLASGGPVSRVAAMGAMARLWQPVTVNADALERALAGEGPGATARRWLRTLPSSMRDEVYQLGGLEADNLGHGLEDLVALIAEREAGAAAVTLHWLRHRDDLECVSFLGEAIEEASRAFVNFRETLKQLDAAAVRWASALRDAGVVRDERLATVFWMEPHSWWGQVGN